MGADFMRGGANADTYQLSRGRDVIRGFNPGEDVIQASVVPDLEQQRRNVLLSYPGGQTLLRNILLNDIKPWLTEDSGGLEILA